MSRIDGPMLTDVDKWGVAVDNPSRLYFIESYGPVVDAEAAGYAPMAAAEHTGAFFGRFTDRATQGKLS